MKYEMKIKMKIDTLWKLLAHACMTDDVAELLKRLYYRPLGRRRLL